MHEENAEFVHLSDFDFKCCSNCICLIFHMHLYCVSLSAAVYSQASLNRQLTYFCPYKRFTPCLSVVLLRSVCEHQLHLYTCEFLLKLSLSACLLQLFVRILHCLYLQMHVDDKKVRNQIPLPVCCFPEVFFHVL